MTMSSETASTGHGGHSVTKRDFLFLATGSLATVGVATTLWPFIDQMNPSTAALALASIEVDLSSIQPGQQVIVKWRGHPLFMRRRTPADRRDLENVAGAMVRERHDAADGPSCRIDRL